jgi:hypothetical protein
MLENFIKIMEITKKVLYNKRKGPEKEHTLLCFSAET